MSWIGQISLTSNLEKMTISHQVSKGREHMYKSGMLWPLRNLLGMLNGTDSNSDRGTFPSKFNKLLTFSYFCKFIKARDITFTITRYPKRHACARFAKTLHCWAKG